MKKTVILMAVTMMGTLVQAELIGVNFEGAGGKPVTGTAGVVAQGNWNNLSGNDTSTPVALINASGGVTGISVAWKAKTGAVSSSLFVTEDQKLHYGRMEVNVNSYSDNNHIAISDISFESYDLYLYVSGWVDNRNGYAQVLQGDTTTVVGSELGFNTYENFPGTHSESTSTATGDRGTYVLWEGLTDTDINIQWKDTGLNVGVSGFQIDGVEYPTLGTLLIIK